MHALRAAFPALGCWSKRFGTDERGVSAVEFAILLPLMMTLLLGGMEVSNGVAANRKAVLVSRTVADLVSQAKVVNNADMTNILNAARAVLAPFPAAQCKIVVTSVTIDANLKATVQWSDATSNATARAVGEVVTVPAGVAAANTTLIWAEVTYPYTPEIGYVISGTLNLRDQIFMRPRLSASVTRQRT